MNEELRTASDLARDPASVSWATYSWVLVLAAWGGIVRVFREVKLGDKSWKQIALIFIAEMMTSSFAGVLTFFLCESNGVSRLYTAALTGMAGYMGGRTLNLIEAAIHKSRNLKGD